MHKPQWAIKFYNKWGFYPMCGGGGGGGETTSVSHTYFYYKVRAPHNNIDPSQSILCYNAFGVLIYTVPPYYTFMNYGEGILSVPGTEQNITIESIATASYYVFYSTSDLIIDYENAEFKIAKNLIRSPAQSTITATYEYLTIITPIRDVASVIDGRWDTQVQTEFFAEPLTGYNYAILDLGSSYTVQALDIVAGFYKPDEIRKFDIQMSITLRYSLNGTDYFDISDETHSFSLTGGQSKSFEEQDLGVGFQARYFKLILEKVQKIDFGNGVWVVAITEISAYNDILIKSEATLIDTTYMSAAIDLTSLLSGNYPQTIFVDSTAGFDSSGIAYIDNENGTFDSFTYTGITATSFTGVYGLSASHSIDDMVVQTIAGDTTYYDYNGLLPKLKDRLYKKLEVDENILYNATELNRITKAYLKEFQKDHSKINEEVLFSPHLEVGQTISIVDSYNNINNNYFIESITNNSGFYSIIFARYPA